MSHCLVQTLTAEDPSKNPRISKIYRDSKWNEWRVDFMCHDVLLGRAYADSEDEAIDTGKTLLKNYPHTGN